MKDAPSVLVLTEDSGGHAVVAEVFAKLLRLLAPPDLRLDTEPGMLFNHFYKSRNPRDYNKKVDLARAIATHLLIDRQPTGVIVHLDSDRRWSERDAEHLCDNLRSFRDEILPRVVATLGPRVANLDRLVFLLPFRCIESWLFHNFAEARRICDEHHPNHTATLARFDAWRDAPGSLDETESCPKHLVVFGARHNLRLAQHGLSARRLSENSPSFAHTLAAIRGSALPSLFTR